MTNEIKGRLGALMMAFYLVNTIVAMIIGLTLTNLVRPGIGAMLSGTGATAQPPVQKSVTELLMDLIPRSIGEPFTQNHLAQLVVLTLRSGSDWSRSATARRRGARPRSRSSLTC